MRKASSIVSQLAEHGKLEPRPCFAICTVPVPQIIWVVCQAVGNWRPFSVRELGNHRVYCPGLKLVEATKQTKGTKIKGPISGHGGGTNTNEKSQTTVTEETA